jgi:hypothetical protein
VTSDDLIVQAEQRHLEHLGLPAPPEGAVRGDVLACHHCLTDVLEDALSARYLEGIEAMRRDVSTFLAGVRTTAVRVQSGLVSEVMVQIADKAYDALCTPPRSSR